MNKNSTKVILLLSIVLILGLFFWGWSIYQGKKKTITESPAEKCEILPGQIIAFCKLNPFGIPEYITDNKQISLVNNGKNSSVTIPVVHSGDKIIGRFDISQFLKQYPNVREKLNTSLMICLRSSSLEGQRIFSPSTLQRFNRYNYGFYACSVPLKLRNIRTLDFGGVVPYLSEAQKKKYNVFYFSLYLIDASRKEEISEEYKNMLKVIQHSSPLITSYLQVQ